MGYRTITIHTQTLPVQAVVGRQLLLWAGHQPQTQLAGGHPEHDQCKLEEDPGPENTKNHHYIVDVQSCNTCGYA